MIFICDLKIDHIMFKPYHVKLELITPSSEQSNMFSLYVVCISIVAWVVECRQLETPPGFGLIHFQTPYIFRPPSSLCLTLYLFVYSSTSLSHSSSLLSLNLSLHLHVFSSQFYANLAWYIFRPLYLFISLIILCIYLFNLLFIYQSFPLPIFLPFILSFHLIVT